MFDTAGFVLCVFVPGAAHGQVAVAWVTSVPALCGSATQKRGSRGTLGMSLTTRNTTSSPSCLRLVSVKGYPHHTLTL